MPTRRQALTGIAAAAAAVFGPNLPCTPATDAGEDTPRTRPRPRRIPPAAAAAITAAQCARAARDQ